MAPNAATARLHAQLVSSNMSMSIVTDTNSTVSGIPGPGRTLGVLLSGGGRRVESAINRTVERLGYSPNATMQRILAILRVWHVYNCQGPQFAKPSRVAPEFSVLIEEAAILSSELCPMCRCFYFQKIPNVDLDLRITSQLEKLLEFLQHKVISTRCLAAHYLYALVIMDTSICDALLKAEAVQALEAVLTQVATNKWADEEWFTLEAPVRQTLQALQTAAPWFPSVPSSQRDQPHVYFPALVRLSRQPGPLGLMCLRRLSSVLDFWSGGFQGFRPSLPPDSLLSSICSSITQDDLRTWYEHHASSPIHQNVRELLAKYLIENAKTLAKTLGRRLQLFVIADFTWNASADRAWATRGREVSMEELGIPWLQIWDDKKLALVLGTAFARHLLEDPISEHAMTRIAGSIDIVTSTDAPAWMMPGLAKVLISALNSKGVIARLWETVPSSSLACECLGALYRMRAMRKAVLAARPPDARTRPLWEVQNEAAQIASNALGRWQHMYFPLAHWIHSRSRPCPVFEGPLEDNGCELCISVKDPAYLQMLSDAAAKDMSGSKPSGADVHANSQARFTFRPALLILESTFRWTQTTTDLILADIMASIEVRTSDMEATVEGALVSYGQAH